MVTQGMGMVTQGVDIVTKGGTGYGQEVGGLWIWSGDSYGCIRLLHLPQMMDRFCHTDDRRCHKASQRSWAAVDGYYGYGHTTTPDNHLLTWIPGFWLHVHKQVFLIDVSSGYLILYRR